MVVTNTVLVFFVHETRGTNPGTLAATLVLVVRHCLDANMVSSMAGDNICVSNFRRQLTPSLPPFDELKRCVRCVSQLRTSLDTLKYHPWSLSFRPYIHAL